MSCLSWRGTFHGSWENKSKFQMGGLRETGGLPLFSPEGRTYSPPAKAGGGSPPVGRARALSEGDCGSCGSRWTRLHFYQTASLAHAVGAGVSTLEAPVHGVVYCHPIPPPACVNLPPAAWHRYRGGTICSTPAGGTSYLTTYLLQLSTEEGLLRFTVALQKGR